MGRPQTSAKGIRLPNELWALIDKEAAFAELSRSEYLARRIRRTYARDNENRKADEYDQKVAANHEEMVRYDDDGDE